MDVDLINFQINKAWKELIIESPIYSSMSSKELRKSKNFFTLGYYRAIKDGLSKG